jgi:pyruvate/2-oxoglutarate dehydrogenase complex dihydrolipoamide acyltransferase (E2) component
MTRTATLCVLVASVSLSAQTTPPSGSSVSVTGCIAQVQRDGSTGAKPSGTQATPETAAVEANNPTPTGRYQLLDATPVGTDMAKPAGADASKPVRTSYALRGLEQQLGKHMGHRVQVAGTLAPPLAAKLPSTTAATAEGIRTVQVTSVKMIGTDCSAEAAGQ